MSLESALFYMFLLMTQGSLELFYHQADVPKELWSEFDAVVACESYGDPYLIGDNGSAIGILQIHEYPWNIPYSDGKYNLLEPKDSFELALEIHEYDLVRKRDRWNQWSVKPHWRQCQLREIDIRQHIFN